MNLSDDILWPHDDEEELQISPDDNFDFNFSQIKIDRYENRD